MVKQTMTTFPDRPAGDEKLYHTLDLINDQEAERTFMAGDYYQRIGKVASAEFYFGKIAQRWPKSAWAAKAKTQLAALAKLPRKQSLPSKIMTQPGSTDPFGGSGRLRRRAAWAAAWAAWAAMGWHGRMAPARMISIATRGSGGGSDRLRGPWRGGSVRMRSLGTLGRVRRDPRRRRLALARPSWPSAGCGYSIRAPFDPDVRTVYVPVFRSITFRRDVNLQLTELVRRRSSSAPPSRSSALPRGPTRSWTGTINFADKNIIVENPFNLPRQLTATLIATVNWTHNPPLEKEMTAAPVVVAETVNFVPEVGETSHDRLLAGEPEDRHADRRHDGRAVVRSADRPSGATVDARPSSKAGHRP